MMKIVTDLPYKVKIIENVFIPMKDGKRLAARVWLPERAQVTPLPAILEYIPYRKRDMSRGRDTNNHDYLAGHGYVCVRVDIRGSGDSEGILTDEYTDLEIEDGIEVISWLTQQPWCDGNVGMMGISWGGFNSLQIAARNPPGLKAIMSACASDDTYSDNMHFMGGCLLGDNLSEATVMFAFNTLPPDPKIVGTRWRQMWHERLESGGLWLEPWLRNHTRSDYWRKSSVCERYESIQVPALIVGGWADGFTNAVFRLLDNLTVPRLGLIGPWGHKYSHQGIPGPPIGFLQELVRWWDYWLKNIDTGIMDEPMLRAWLQDSVPPHTSYDTRPGRWVGLPSWPSPEVKDTPLSLLDTKELEFTPEDSSEQTWFNLQSPLFVGVAAGKWCSYAAPPDLPGDQREEDGGALIFDTAPLTTDLEFLGCGWLDLEVISNRPTGMIAARISDVAPNGEATRITYGLLNLTHHESDEQPSHLCPGEPYRVRIQLNGFAQRFPVGHKLRLSLSSSYWPLAWVPYENPMLSIGIKKSCLHLPLLAAGSGENVSFDEPEHAPDLEVEPIEPSHHNWRVIKELDLGTSTLEVTNDQGSFVIPEIGTKVTRSTNEWYSYRDNDVNSALGETQTRRALARDDWDVEILTRTILTADPEKFHVHAQLDAYEQDERIYSKNWSFSIQRDFY